jgi:hypothetical protein
VDNMIQRIIENGFTDGKGGKYNPNILRLGMGRFSTVLYYTVLFFLAFFYVFSFLVTFFILYFFFVFHVFPFLPPRGSGVRVVSLEDTLEQEHEAFMDDTNR